MRFSFFPFLLLSLPLVEIAGFVLVGRQIGVLPTLGLIIATGIAGGMLLRFQGFGVMTRIRKEIKAGRDPSRDLAHGVMILLAGLLLLIPGFFTDIFGILLFTAPVRDIAWRALKSRITLSPGFGSAGGFSRPGGASRGKTIDLDAGDYSKDKDRDTPWRRIDDE
ncbi:MAG: membrane protein FxsA [Pseudaminobacter sp.]|nr:membrane protein FxsA [Pseudaminobacter sp.]